MNMHRIISFSAALKALDSMQLSQWIHEELRGDIVPVVLHVEDPEANDLDIQVIAGVIEKQSLGGLCHILVHHPLNDELTRGEK